MPRIAPQCDQDWAPELKTFMTGYRSAVIGDDGVAAARPAGANAFGVLARHPALATAFLAFSGHLQYRSTLPGRYRELLILRVAVLRKCAYEWAQHVLLAADAGLTEAEISRVRTGPDAPPWTPLERALLRAADELVGVATISDATWATLAAGLTEHQLMDLVFTVGAYEMVAMTFHALGVEPDSDMAPYLPTEW
ncbi:MAG TPA: carboxymuconolactone decarboxylase family protein [Trebonia sp.]|nr:carboxymuconolactone decarboxylase family protein [Trebonia sp.]